MEIGINMGENAPPVADNPLPETLPGPIPPLPKKRCPKGTRKNRKGDCVPNAVPNAVSNPARVPDAIPVVLVHEDTGLAIPVSSRIANCPKGSRRNRKGKCMTPEELVVPEVVPATEPVAEPPLVVEAPPAPPAPIDKPGKTGKNAFLNEKERFEVEQHRESSKTSAEESSPEIHDLLYPDLNDFFFQQKIARRKEFHETQFDGTIYDIAKQSDRMCDSKFELMPHQLFVKNFLSAQTPYNSLLLYHGLGTGKTCSAIGIAEEMRQYMMQVGIRDKILVVASPNVQANFRAQLFDESKLEQVFHPTNPGEFHWKLDTCVGESLLREIDPTGLRNVPREKIVSNITTIIHTWYEFMGYGQLANYITQTTKVKAESGYTEDERRAIELKKIRNTFNHRFLLIDEVHNITQTENNKLQTTGALLMQVVKHATSMRLLLLSATPMFDNYKEIIWLTNLMNANDKRSLLDVSDIFDANGEFREPSTPGGEGGREWLARKLTGYVSYVRGENPYTFPFRIYPDVFAKDRTFVSGIAYPSLQVNERPVPAPLKHIRVYLHTIRENTYQKRAYQYLVKSIRHTMQTDDMQQFELLQKPIECLNIAYPQGEVMSERDLPYSREMAASLIGEAGFHRIMTYRDKGVPVKQQFEYKPGVVEKFGRVFSPEKLPMFSQKMAEIGDLVRKSDGIILIYSQYLDGGVVPMALALEEMGFAKFGTSAQTQSLFRQPPVEAVDAITMLPKSQMPNPADFQPAKYMMITGDKMYSPNNAADIAYAKLPENRDGSKVKVILISKAGSEGLDFKHIRQIHILEPWFNMNRLEQIIGRGVRNQSHCALPFEQRNVQIYLHATRFEDDDEEPADLYVYRLAEKKSLQIGKVSRLLKTVAVDCILNIGQSNMTAEKLAQVAANQRVEIQLSTRERIRFRVGDQPFTDICDYMDTCEVSCRAPETSASASSARITATYTPDIVESNESIIAKRIRDLYREHHVYKRGALIRSINLRRVYPIEHIFQTLSKFLQNTHEWLVDKYGRNGYLVNHGEYYVFQPVEIGDERASVFERAVPVDYKRESVSLEIPKQLPLDPLRGKTEPALVPVATSRTFAEILQGIIANHAITEQFREVKGGDKDWYRNCSHVMDHLIEKYHLSRDVISQYVVEHSIDEMPFAEKRVLVETIWGAPPEWTPGNKYEQWVFDYLDKKRVVNASQTRQGILLANGSEVVLLVRSLDASEWMEGEESDFRDFKDDLREKHNVSKTRLHRIIGYIVDFKEKEMIFKFKDITLTRNKLGARCDSAGKADIIKMLNSVVGDVYTQENTATLFQPKLCVILEILLREYTRTAKNQRVYFLTPEQSIVGEITRYSSSQTKE